MICMYERSFKRYCTRLCSLVRDSWDWAPAGLGFGVFGPPKFDRDPAQGGSVTIPQSQCATEDG